MISTSPRHANSRAGTNTTASRRTCPRLASGPGWPGWRRRGRPATAAGDPHDEAHLPRPRSRSRSSTPSSNCTAGTRSCTSASSTWPAMTGSTRPGGAGRRPGGAPHRLAAGSDAAVESLDQVSAPVAEALLGGIRGLAAGITGDRPGSGQGRDEAALAAARDAHARLVGHVERAAAEGDPDPALGGPGLAALMGGAEALPVDLGRLAEQADSRTGPAARPAGRRVRQARPRPRAAGPRRGPRPGPGPSRRAGVIERPGSGPNGRSSSRASVTWFPTMTGSAW